MARGLAQVEDAGGEGVRMEGHVGALTAAGTAEATLHYTVCQTASASASVTVCQTAYTRVCASCLKDSWHCKRCSLWFRRDCMHGENCLRCDHVVDMTI